MKTFWEYLPDLSTPWAEMNVAQRMASRLRWLIGAVIILIVLAALAE